MSGDIVYKGRSRELGRVATIQVGPHEYDGYAHITRRTIRRSIDAGQRVGVLAGRRSIHGTAWTGPHLHLTRGATVSSMFGVGSVDPKPAITSALK